MAKPWLLAVCLVTGCASTHRGMGPSLAAVQPSNPDQQLVEAVRNQDSSGVAAALAKGADAKQMVEGQSILELAVRGNEDDIARQLLKAGANPNAKDSNADTPLTIAYNNRRNGDSLVLAMLDAGGDYSYYKPGDWTLSHFAVTDPGDGTLLKKLLEKGLDPNGFEVDDSAYVIRNGHLYPDTSVKPKKGQSYLYEATANHSSSAIKLLLDHGANPNISTPGGTPPIFAAPSGGLSVLKLFVEHGANVNARDASGRSLLGSLVAASKSQMGGYFMPHLEEQIAYLKAHGARLTAREKRLLDSQPPRRPTSPDGARQAPV